MAPIVLRYPLDPTGVSPDNLVVGEPHTLNARPVRIIVPTYGAFYSASVVLRDVTNQRNLVKGTDWRPAELYEVPSAKFGKEVCSIILITNAAVSANVTLQYQCVGGEFSTSAQAIKQMVDSIDLDDRPVKWGDIIGKPSEFNPAHHLHDVGDIYGFEYLTQACENIRRAILLGDVASHDEIYRYVDAAIAALRAEFAGGFAGFQAHINDRNNPHGVTAEQLDVYRRAAVDQRLTDQFNDYNAKIEAEKVKVITVGPGTVLDNRNAYNKRYIRVSGGGPIYVNANTFAYGDILYIAAAAGQPVTVTPINGMQIVPPYGCNMTIPGSMAAVALVFADVNYAEMLGTTQYV